MKVKRMKGFTLAELLIVMAIVVVLAAVAIPTFGRQLETARETGDMEIIRNAYTEALTTAIEDATDGKFDGKIGNTSFGAADSTGIAVPTTASDSEGTYTVTIATAIKGAKFSQNGTSTAAGAWTYVSNKLYDLIVPPVNSNVISLAFKFKFDTTGEVVVAGTGSSSATTDLFVAAYAQ